MLKSSLMFILCMGINLGGDISLITSDSETKKQLYCEYNWFYKIFLPSLVEAGEEFYNGLFEFKLISVSKNVNILFQGDEYFVTKIRINKNYDAFFRCSSDAVKLMLDNTLGEKGRFSLASITNLEAKIISTFNDYVYEKISTFLLSPPPVNQKRKNFDTIHLTFFVKDKKENSGKLIISIPSVLLAPEALCANNAHLDIYEFSHSKLDVKIKLGTTKFSLKDLKNLEKDDLVIFDDSVANSMKLIYKDYEKDFRIIPNPGLITTINNDDVGGSMDGSSVSQDLWDNIQVEMGAEFDKVKITLGELKNIEEGLVVDISSVYDNKVSLKVENKIIAKGELVIVNDRYGVRVDEVFASEKTQAEDESQEVEEYSHDEIVDDNEDESVEDEFDYSDFEIDDQDI